MIIGIDPGTRKLALFSSSGMSESIVLPRSDRWRELRDLKLMLYQVFDVWSRQSSLEHVYCEEPVVAGARNLRTTIGIAETVGVVLSAGVPVTLVPVASWKKAVIGHGSAKKEDVSEWFRQRFNLESIDQDIADAAAICEYGVQDMETADRLKRHGLRSTD